MPSLEGFEDDGSEPVVGFEGVRNGDLNGLCSVFVASFSRRRLASGVDMSTFAVALETSRSVRAGWVVVRVDGGLQVSNDFDGKRKWIHKVQTD